MIWCSTYDPTKSVDIGLLKANVAAYAAKITKDEEYDAIRDQLKSQVC